MYAGAGLALMLALNIEQYEYMKGAQDEAGIKVMFKKILIRCNSLHRKLLVYLCLYPFGLPLFLLHDTVEMSC